MEVEQKIIVFVRRYNTEEVNKKLFSLFTDQCEPYLNTKPRGTKWYDNVHNAQDGIKLLKPIMIVFCGKKAHQQGIWAMMNSDKNIYTFLQRSNMTNDDYIKY